MQMSIFLITYQDICYRKPLGKANNYLPTSIVATLRLPGWLPG